VYYVVTEILRELFREITAWLDKRPRVAQGLGAASGIVALWLVYATGASLLFGPPADAIAYRKVRGTVLYEDGSVIPSGPLLLELAPSVDRAKAKGDRTAAFVVDGKTGEFSGVMTYQRSNKARTMPYRAVLRTAEQAAVPAAIVPMAYGELAATPARVNVMDRHLAIRIRKPQ
jgi:hypothetical protein